jgi:hypothetical protein
MLVEIGFFTLLAARVRKALKGSKITPEREVFFHEALANLSGPGAPKKFRAMAKRYAEWGHTTHAAILKRRAEYLEATPAQKAARDAVIARAMRSTNVAAIRNVADHFEYLTATGVARDLRAHADEVQAGTYVPEEKKTAEKAQNGHVEVRVETN